MGKEFELYPEGNQELLGDFKKGSEILILGFLKDDYNRDSFMRGKAVRGRDVDLKTEREGTWAGKR